jgi:hypothetical protein
MDNFRDGRFLVIAATGERVCIPCEMQWNFCDACAKELFPGASGCYGIAQPMSPAKLKEFG